MEKIPVKDLEKPFSMLIDGLVATWNNRYAAQYWFGVVGGDWNKKELLFDDREVHVKGFHIQIINNNDLFDDWMTPELREKNRIRRNLTNQ